MRVKVPSMIVIAFAILLLSACSDRDASSGTTATTPAVRLDLGPRNVGPYELGDPAAVVIDGMSSLIGGWDGDSEEADGNLPPALCGSETVRQVSWGNLVLFFDLGDAAAFVSWAYGFDPIRGNADNVRGLQLATAAGIGLSSTRQDTERVYAGRLTVDDDPAIDLARFAIDADEPDHMVGVFGRASDPEAPVQSLEHAPRCEQP